MNSSNLSDVFVMELQLARSRHYSGRKTKCAAILGGPWWPKNNPDNIVSFSQSLWGRRRANRPVIKTQTLLSLSLLSSPPPPHPPATQQLQGLTTPNSGGDRISPQTSKHNMEIKHPEKHTHTHHWLYHPPSCVCSYLNHAGRGPRCMEDRRWRWRWG